MVAAGRVTLAGAEVMVEPGAMDPNHIITPGVFVQHLIQARARIEDIEHRTVRPRSEAQLRKILGEDFCRTAPRRTPWS